MQFVCPTLARLNSAATWLALVCLTISGCGAAVPAPPAPNAVPSSPAPAPATEAAPAATDAPTVFPMTVTDSLGRKVTFARPPRRIISIAPKNTELLFAIGAGDQVVGVTSYCNYPPEARTRPQVGGFAAKSLSLENIVDLEPDLVVTADEIHGSIIEELNRLGIASLALGGQSFDELYAELTQLGKISGHAPEANRLVDELKGRVDAIVRTVRTIPAEQRVTVFYQTWDQPLMAAGPASFAGRMIDICGGNNMIRDKDARYPQISQEILLERNPDVIFGPTMTTSHLDPETISAQPGWSGIAAVRNKRIYLIDGDLISRCGPRLVDALEIMAHLLYPDHFQKPAARPETEPSSPSADQN
jgi:cobalamin transport system substrate-binding protein